MSVVNVNVQVKNDGIHFLDGFAIFVASLVLFKFFFALIYQISWTFRKCRKDNKKHKVSVKDQFKLMKEDPNFQYSSGEEEDKNQKQEDAGLQKTHMFQYKKERDQELDDAWQSEEEDIKEDLLRESRRHYIQKPKVPEFAEQIFKKSESIYQSKT